MHTSFGSFAPFSAIPPSLSFSPSPLPPLSLPPPCPQPGLQFTPKPLVYMWGSDVTVPLVLPVLSDRQIVGVACGRSQRAGVTEDGKLFLWEVCGYVCVMIWLFIFPLLLCFPLLLSLLSSLPPSLFPSLPSLPTLVSQIAISNHHQNGSHPGSEGSGSCSHGDDPQTDYWRVLCLY